MATLWGHEDWVRDLFLIIDSDHSGSISLDELKEGIHKYLGNLAQEDCDKLFNFIDHSRDGIF